MRQLNADTPLAKNAEPAFANSAFYSWLRGGDSTDVPRGFLADSRAARGVGTETSIEHPVLSWFASMSIKPRDLMAPDTEPTDEELALVMREARELAVQRQLVLRPPTAAW